MNNKEKIEFKMKELTKRMKELCKLYNRKYSSEWKNQPHGEWALLKAMLKGYRMAEEDLKK